MRRQGGCDRAERDSIVIDSTPWDEARADAGVYGRGYVFHGVDGPVRLWPPGVEVILPPGELTQNEARRAAGFPAVQSSDDLTAPLPTPDGWAAKVGHVIGWVTVAVVVLLVLALGVALVRFVWHLA